MVLFSLFLQILLIMFGSRRKRITRIWIRVLVWSSYLLADMVAAVALGVLSRSQLGEIGDNIQFAKENSSLRAFWAPFLLVHLGGLDTITAFSIEDNDLWLRHLKLEAEKWKVISEVWVEMLTYAAGHCEWRDHAQQLKSGGELLTHVRLLMAHLGLSHQYQEILLS
ncbi:hypothetical protein NC653_008463 [Populus alba x Populus x berolinensis]|uniref:DUF4220 domain-containing protein n=1 Tax=Populus alba x Populus x berolinensis TaxID=444605 RepID=A0AAD6R6U1_9ROSI|nr:hypothetical protein NC653_008463 [Populus alba x Populus x berolinensis]